MAGATVARSSIARADVPARRAGAAVASIDALAADLLRALGAGGATGPANLVLSPLSITTALAMARVGARGRTRAEMDDVLRAGRGSTLDDGLNALGATLANRAGERGWGERVAEVVLAAADAVWAQSGYPIEAPFLDSLAASYGAGVNLVDFVGDADAARAAINDWVASRTADRITDLVADGVLDAMTRVVLTDALHVKAPWSTPLHELGDQPFLRPDGSTVDVPTMASGATGRFGSGPGWRAASIPYLGDELSMVVVVPDDLGPFVTGLDGDRLAAATGRLDQPLLGLQLPRFRFRTQIELSRALGGLGMPTAFGDDADFTGITTLEPLLLSAVVHEGFVAVDEQGTEAAAATAVVVAARAMPMGERLVADRPFLFAIHDDATGANLFVGVVADPSQTCG